jgi:hypothetical protein
MFAFRISIILILRNTINVRADMKWILVATNRIFLEEYVQVALEMLEVGICASL